MRAIATLVIVAPWSATVHAERISELVVFGDSLSDTGNVAQFIAPFPKPPYFGGRFANGPVWVEQLADRLNVARPVASELGGTNYAWGGGTTGSVPPRPLRRNMDVLVAAYLDTNVPRADQLFVLWGGTNDFGFGQRDPSLPVQFLSEQIADLSSAGARNFLLVNLAPYLGSVPVPGAEEFNALLSQRLNEIRTLDPELSIIEFDFFSLFKNVEANPSAFGFSNFRDPACRDCRFGSNDPGGIVRNPDEYFFWDDIHPSAAAHKLIGDAAFRAVVPEPTGLNILSAALLTSSFCRRIFRVA